VGGAPCVAGTWSECLSLKHSGALFRQPAKVGGRSVSKMEGTFLKRERGLGNGFY